MAVAVRFSLTFRIDGVLVGESPWESLTPGVFDYRLLDGIDAGAALFTPAALPGTIALTGERKLFVDLTGDGEFTHAVVLEPNGLVLSSFLNAVRFMSVGRVRGLVY